MIEEIDKYDLKDDDKIFYQEVKYLIAQYKLKECIALFTK